MGTYGKDMFEESEKVVDIVKRFTSQILEGYFSRAWNKLLRNTGRSVKYWFIERLISKKNGEVAKAVLVLST